MAAMTMTAMRLRLPNTGPGGLFRGAALRFGNGLTLSSGAMKTWPLCWAGGTFGSWRAAARLDCVCQVGQAPLRLAVTAHMRSPS